MVLLHGDGVMDTSSLTECRGEGGFNSRMPISMGINLVFRDQSIKIGPRVLS